MRILHVGNFGTRAKGAFLHSVAPKLSRGLVRNGHHVVDFDDRQIARAATPLGARKLGGFGVNRLLTRMAMDMRPDVLLLGHADTIRPGTIAAIRRAIPALRVLQWNVDPVFEPDNVERLRRKLEVVDATLVSTAGEALAPLRRPGMRLGFLPNPVDFSLESGRADLVAEPEHDLFYACGHPARLLRHVGGRQWDMSALLRGLQTEIGGLRLLTAGLNGRAVLVGDAYQQALSSCAVGLNASRRNDVWLYSSDRLAHMAGNGQAVLVDRATGYNRLFGAGEMAFFSGFDELRAVLRRLLAEPAARQAMASAGRARYHELFNERLVADYVLDVALDRLDPGALPWPSLFE